MSHGEDLESEEETEGTYESMLSKILSIELLGSVLMFIVIILLAWIVDILF